MISREESEMALQELDRAIESVDTSHLGYIAVIGSNPESRSNDVDVLTLRNPGSKIGESLIANGQLMIEYGRRLSALGYESIPFPRKILQHRTQHIANQHLGNTPTIPTHNLFFPTSTSFIMLNPQGFREGLEETRLKGDLSILEDLQEFTFSELPAYFKISDLQTELLAGKFPESLLVEEANSTLKSLSKYDNLQEREVYNSTDAQKALHEALLELDS